MDKIEPLLDESQISKIFGRAVPLFKRTVFAVKGLLS
jgi:hypothetical protein